MDDKKTAAKLAISTRLVGPIRRGLVVLTISVNSILSCMIPNVWAIPENISIRKLQCQLKGFIFTYSLSQLKEISQVCAFILVYEQWMSHQPEVKDSPTIFVPLNTPALYRVDQLKGFFQSLESRAFQTTCCRLNCSTFRNMKSQLQEQVIGIPVSCQYDKPSLSNGSRAIIQSKTLSLSLFTLRISC
ncbi:hypothetical protein CK203_079108 [Vitis vinifera]|uniref:Uncharacterized protein n=1 Tax=Vitis vinifera TaxID=29760 RepID=A0A438BYG3_VITVI|nr:hypothetical protein CK203_079108 [Vitis vinifera]